MTRTKMICTIGPASSSYDKILELLDAGMNVARINLSHGSHQEHAEVIAHLKKARKVRGIPLALMVDTKGCEIRLGEIAGNSKTVQEGDQIELVRYSQAAGEIVLTPDQAFDSLKKGMKLLFDDGYIEGKITHLTSERASVEIMNPGVLKSHKKVTLSKAQIDLPAMTPQDKSDLAFACKQDIDWVAASFIRSQEHVCEIQNLLKENGKADILVMAKIESAEGVENFTSILGAADGIMVARGDLGVELPIEKVPALQKTMIQQCNEVSKPVVTATQMLESMIYNPRPTRAEVSDVANAIYDSSSAVMLSGETAVGKYPVETVAMMRQIIQESELDFDYRDFYDQNLSFGFSSVASSIASAAVQTGYTTEAKAIFVFTCSGITARLISRFRPEIPVVALTPNEKTYHQLALEWGVIPLQAASALSLQEAICFTSHYALEHKLVKKGDRVVVTTGTPFWKKGTTNTLIVESITV